MILPCGERFFVLFLFLILHRQTGKTLQSGTKKKVGGDRVRAIERAGRWRGVGSVYQCVWHRLVSVPASELGTAVRDGQVMASSLTSSRWRVRKLSRGWWGRTRLVSAAACHLGLPRRSMIRLLPDPVAPNVGPRLRPTTFFFFATSAVRVRPSLSHPPDHRSTVGRHARHC